MGNYERVAQRFVLPIYIKAMQTNDSIEFISTATLIEFNSRKFMIIPAHAVNSSVELIKNLGVINGNGEFNYLINHATKHKMYNEFDVIIFEIYIDRYYFNLNSVSNELPKLAELCWIGFPKKEATSFHKTKQEPSKIKDSFVDRDNINLIFKNASFRLIKTMTDINDDGTHIFGKYTNRNVFFKKAGFKQNGGSLSGMSGGAMFFCQTNKLTGNETLDELTSQKDSFYQFAGIGLLFSDKKEIIQGLSQNKLKELLIDEYWIND